MKKIFLICLVVFILFSICACGESEQKITDSSDSISSTESAKVFNWADVILGDLLPAPESNCGDLVLNYDDSLLLYIHDTSKEQYQSYISACREKGFTIDVDEYDTVFTAKDEIGYELSICYFESDEEMSISLSAPIEKSEESMESTISNNVDENNEESPKDFIDDFISKYNNIAKTPILNVSRFDPKDRESGYYRTEYRLNAWDGSIGAIGAIGDARIEMVNYGSYGGNYENEDFRIYVIADSVEEIIDMFPELIKTIDSTVTEDEINEIIEDVTEYGDSNIIIGDLSGYITQTEMMLDI